MKKVIVIILILALIGGAVFAGFKLFHKHKDSLVAVLSDNEVTEYKEKYMLSEEEANGYFEQIGPVGDRKIGEYNISVLESGTKYIKYKADDGDSIIALGYDKYGFTSMAIYYYDEDFFVFISTDKHYSITNYRANRSN